MKDRYFINSKIIIMKKQLFLLLPLIGAFVTSRAQDPIFSSSDQIQQYINPAFVGTANNLRAGLVYQNRWPGIAGYYRTTIAYADQYLNKHHSVGVMYLNDNSANMFYKNMLKLNYSYSINFEKSILKFGIGAGLTNSSMDLSKYSGYVINPSTGFVYNTSTVNSPYSNVSAFDMNTGVLYKRDKFYAGYSAAHLTRPNLSLIGGESRLPVLHSLQLGNRFEISEKESIIIGANGYYQGGFNTMSVFVQNKFKFLIASAGYWVNSAVFARLGVTFKSFRVLYSYDYPTTKLGNASSLATHELALQGYFKTTKKVNDRMLRY